MSNTNGLLRFAYQKKPVARYSSDLDGKKHEARSEPLQEEQRTEASEDGKTLYLEQLFPEVSRNTIAQAISQSCTIDEAQTKLIEMLGKKTRKRVRIASDSSDEGVAPKVLQDEPTVPPTIPNESYANHAKEEQGQLQSDNVSEDGLEEDLSDGSCDDEEDDAAKQTIVAFFNGASISDMLSVPTCSKRRAEAIQAVRPFTDWPDLKHKFISTRSLTLNIVERCKELLDTRQHVLNLMNQCQDIALRIDPRVKRLLEASALTADDGHIANQPHTISSCRNLTHYQMVGLNWLQIMYQEKVNALLADEMGLGKTCQVIAFLAYLLEAFGQQGPHIIIVPSSTLDNWARELRTWCPALTVLVYSGNQSERAELRRQFEYGIDDDSVYNVLLTTYSFITSTAVDRALYKKNEFHCAVFDEAHALKNMTSQRYKDLMKIQAKHRLLLTGTPLQNNLVELMSLLCFVMPHVFVGKEQNLIKFFSSITKDEDVSRRVAYERDQVTHAKRIMKPFVLRRLKKQVLTELPKKETSVQLCHLVGFQSQLYSKIKTELTTEVLRSGSDALSSSNGKSLCMQLRKASNHRLLLRGVYDSKRLQAMAAQLLTDASHRDAEEELIVEDMEVMSDFELHLLCKRYRCLAEYSLSHDQLVTSAKLCYLDSLLPELHAKGDRLLIFSQFTSMLSILEEYLHIRGYSYLRLDGSTSPPDRQALIDRYNSDPSLFVFLLSTRAGGVGINLTAANVVIIHDIDYNPYNDKQAEDRCHRVGQTRDVKVIRLIADNSIEIAMLQVASDKLKLDEDIHHNSGSTGDEDFSSTVLKLILEPS